MSFYEVNQFHLKDNIVALNANDYPNDMNAHNQIKETDGINQFKEISAKEKLFTYKWMSHIPHTHYECFQSTRFS